MNLHPINTMNSVKKQEFNRYCLVSWDAGLEIRDLGFEIWDSGCAMHGSSLKFQLVNYRDPEIWKLARDLTARIHCMTQVSRVISPFAFVAVKMARRQGATRECIHWDTRPRSNAGAEPFSPQPEGPGGFRRFTALPRLGGIALDTAASLAPRETPKSPPAKANGIITRDTGATSEVRNVRRRFADPSVNEISEVKYPRRLWTQALQAGVHLLIPVLCDRELFADLRSGLNTFGAKLNRFIQSVDSSHQSIKEDPGEYNTKTFEENPVS